LVHRVGNEAVEGGRYHPIEAARNLWGRTRRAEGRGGPTRRLSRSAGEQDRMLPPVVGAHTS
jgi:hypothetical protein